MNLTLKSKSDGSTIEVSLLDLLAKAKFDHINDEIHYLDVTYLISTSHDGGISQDVADDATVTGIKADVHGHGSIFAFDAGVMVAHATFAFNKDATVTILTSSDNVADADTDTKMCIYQGAADATGIRSIVIKNRLGKLHTIKAQLNY